MSRRASARSGVRRRQKTRNGRTRWDTEKLACAGREISADNALHHLDGGALKAIGHSTEIAEVKVVVNPLKRRRRTGGSNREEKALSVESITDAVRQPNGEFSGRC
jgi:hypothetical protein